MMTLEKTTNEIRVEMVLRAPKSKVWSALTTPEGWTAWFSEDIEGDFQVGSRMSLGFDGCGNVEIEVAEREEEKAFAYFWHPGGGDPVGGDDQRTTVRFEISDDPIGTRLVMTESGFANIPEARRISAFKDNEGGWKAELGELEAWVNDDICQPSTKNLIIKERVFTAPLQKVWNALATGEGLSSWFCKRASGTFALGEMVTLTFQFSGEEIDGPMKVVEYDPMSKFAWRWHPGQDDGCKWTDFPESETTLVSFTFAEVEGGTEVKLVETGFENIPESRRIKVLGMNREGWTEVFQMVSDYLAKS